MPPFGGNAEKQSAQRGPHPRPSASEAVKPGDLGTPTSTPNLPSPRNAHPPRAARDSYPPSPRREDRNTARGSAARVPPRSLGRRRCLRAGCASPAGPAASGRGHRGKAAWVRGGVGTPGPPGPGRGAGGRSAARRPGTQAGALPSAPGSSCPATAGKLLPLRVGAGGAVASAAPKLAEEGAPRWERPRGSGSRGGEAGAQPSPYLSGRAPPPRALAGRSAPKSPRGGGPVGGFRTGGEDLVPPPRRHSHAARWFVWKTARETERGSRAPASSPCRQRRSKHTGRALAEAAVTPGGRPLAHRDGCWGAENSRSPLFKGKP